MTMLVVGLYDTSKEANKAIDKLKDEGINRSDIELIEHSEKKESHGFFKSLFNTGGGKDLDSEDLAEMGISRDDAAFYTNAVHDGRSLLIVRCDERDTSRVRSILAQFQLSTYGKDSSRTRDTTSGTTRGRVEREPTGSMPGEGFRGESGETLGGPSYAKGSDRERVPSRDNEPDSPGRSAKAPAESGNLRSDDDRSIRGQERRASGSNGSGKKFEEVEEELHVGKRRVDTGEGVRVTSEVREEEVEQDIELKQEHVDVERRNVDKRVDPDQVSFEEESLEFSETREEPIVRKEARVKEEVVIGKDVDRETETVRETLRSKHVNVEDLYKQAGEDSGRYNQFQSDFQNHYDDNYGADTTAGKGGDYDEYSVGYRYGMALAEHEPYRGKSWDEVEPEAKRGWETHNKGTWHRFGEAVRFGWNRIRGDEEQDRPSGRV